MPMPKQDEFVAGKYRLGEELGRGGMGVVFRARSRSGKPFAIKLMLPPQGVIAESSWMRAERLQRFQREAQVAERVQHPNLIRIYGFGVDFDFDTQEQYWYLAMELLEGETLDDRLTRFNAQARTFSVVETCSLLRPCMHGVAALHEAGIVHRDLKPSNIFVCSKRDGQRGDVPVVMDFGIAKVADTEGPQAKLTRTGVIIGTPFYMSPEQRMGLTIDARTDVYAFGVILYELLAGTQETLAFIGARRAPRPLSSVRSDLPAGLEEVVGRALAHDPGARYQTILELYDALGPYENKERATERADYRVDVPTRDHGETQPSALVTTVLGHSTQLSPAVHGEVTTSQAGSRALAFADTSYVAVRAAAPAVHPQQVIAGDAGELDSDPPRSARAGIVGLTVVAVVSALAVLSWGLSSARDSQTARSVAEVTASASVLQGTGVVSPGAASPSEVTAGPHVTINTSADTETPRKPAGAEPSAIAAPSPQPAPSAKPKPSRRSRAPAEAPLTFDLDSPFQH